MNIDDCFDASLAELNKAKERAEFANADLWIWSDLTFKLSDYQKGLLTIEQIQSEYSDRLKRTGNPIDRKIYQQALSFIAPLTETAIAAKQMIKPNCRAWYLNMNNEKVVVMVTGEHDGLYRIVGHQISSIARPEELEVIDTEPPTPPQKGEK